MTFFESIAVILTVAAIAGYINERIIKWPPTIGLLAISLSGSVLLVIFGGVGLVDLDNARLTIEAINFEEVVLNGMLAFLLFAGAVNEAGAPLFDLDAGQSVPLLAYSAGAFLGRSVNLLLRQRALRSTTVYETAMADSLKSMALQGMGVAWVPRLSVTAELARGELAICGGEHWQIPLEIRLYRCALVRKAAVRLLWRKLETGEPARA